MDEALTALDPKKHRIASAGLATQRSSIVCWNRADGRALSPVISWQDRRATDFIDAMTADPEAIHQRTGLFLSPHYGASKLRWCLDHLCDVAKAAENGLLAFGPLASFITARLTREKAFLSDPANASRTLLWSRHTQNWDDMLCQIFGIPKDALPRCVPSRQAFGHLSLLYRDIPPRVEEREKLEDPPLVILTGDQSAALFSAGKTRSDTLYINLGTGAFLQRVQTHPPEGTGRLLSSVVFSDAATTIYALEGTVNGAASALQAFGDEYKAMQWPEKLETWLAHGSSRLPQHGESKKPPLFINAVGGLASPFWEPRLTSRFIGDGDFQERFTAVLESILFLIQCNIDEMNTLIRPPDEVCLSGGLGRWDGLCQRLADLSGLPVKRNSQHEGTSRGLAYLLSEPFGHGSSRDSGASTCGEWPAQCKIESFSPKTNLGLKQRYVRWQTAMQQAIKDLHPR